MTYLDNGGSFGVQLSPDAIKVGGLRRPILETR